MKTMSNAIFTIVCMTLLSCSAGSSALNSIPVENALTRVVANSNFKVADNASFASAFILYKGGTPDAIHKIPIGDYLLSRIVLSIPEDLDISSIRLLRFEARIDPDGIVMPHARCRGSCNLEIIYAGQTLTISVPIDQNLGPFYVYGSYSPPYSQGLPGETEPAIHAQVKKAVDQTARDISSKFASLKKIN